MQALISLLSNEAKEKRELKDRWDSGRAVGLSCVKKEILIGGKEKEDCYACFEEEKRGERKNKKASYTLKPSWSLHSGLQI